MLHILGTSRLTKAKKRGSIPFFLQDWPSAFVEWLVEKVDGQNSDQTGTGYEEQSVFKRMDVIRAVCF